MVVPPEGRGSDKVQGRAKGRPEAMNDAEYAAGLLHGMLVPDLATYACERRDFLLLARGEAEAPALHYRFLNRRVDQPLHPSWAEWLWDRGLASGETEALDSVGIHAYRCRPDVAQLEEDIGAAVRRGRLTVSDGNDLAEAA
jgi:hypothetical protein